MSAPVRFRVQAAEPGGRARCGRLDTPHGAFETPAFMAVGTQATVKTLDPRDLREAGCRIILANAYHLALRPGAERISRLGGLHRFMGWEGPILTDSGGYQLFSLAPLARATDEGVDFQSHLDGARQTLTPERAVEIQWTLGPDVTMAFDHVVPGQSGRAEVEDALARTERWLVRARAQALPALRASPLACDHSMM